MFRTDDGKKSIHAVANGRVFRNNNDAITAAQNVNYK